MMRAAPTEVLITEHLAHMRLRGLRPATLNQRRGVLLRLQAQTGKPLTKITCEDLEAWQESLSYLSARYRAQLAMNVARFFAWAYDHGHVPVNPAGVLIRPKVPRPVPRPISEDDLDFALTAAPHRVRAMLALAAFAGLRAGEIAKLTRDRVLDNANPPVLIVDGKGGHQRVVPASTRVVMELRAAGMPSRGYVFPREDGRPGGVTPSRVSNMCNAFLHDMGIKDTLHSLRHRAATQIYRTTLDLRLTQELMGHRDPATTAGYAAFSASRALEAVERISTLDDDSTVEEPTLF